MTDLRLIAFDLDDTLAPSKSSLPDVMADLLARLLDRILVSVISGAHFSQFSEQVLSQLPEGARLERLHLLPACGTQYFAHRDGEWRCVYAESLPASVRRDVVAALQRHARALGLWEDRPWGPIVEDRRSQITFSALGQVAPLDAKASWDPSGVKRAALADAVQQDFPELSVRAGGSTSIDVTRRGIDKAYGVRRLAERTGVAIEEMVFVGDRLDPAGNDHPVLETGIATRAVSDWTATADFIRSFLDDGEGDCSRFTASPLTGGRPTAETTPTHH